MKSHGYILFFKVQSIFHTNMTEYSTVAISFTIFLNMMAKSTYFKSSLASTGNKSFLYLSLRCRFKFLLKFTFFSAVLHCLY